MRSTVLEADTLGPRNIEPDVVELPGCYPRADRRNPPFPGLATGGSAGYRGAVKTQG